LAIRVAINGFGRIGRGVAKVISSRDDILLEAINDIKSPDMIEYLTKFDSVHGFTDVKLSDNYLCIGDTTRAKLSLKNSPRDIEFGDVDVVFECSGKFLTQELSQPYLDNGAKKVIFSAPSLDDTPTFVLGVNAQNYQQQQIISNASCTTNCLGPIAKILSDTFGIQKGLMTTIHSYTNDQNILDLDHKSDKRKARAAGINMIPTSTGAAKAMKLVMPELKDKLHGQSVRVPTPNVSMVDLNILLDKNTTKEQINSIFKESAEGRLKGILSVDNQMRVSSDIIGDTHSCIIAEDLTQVVDGNMLKIMAWYDNEWGYSNRLVEMAIFISDSYSK
jgi:glyceraldehyde 3-phosphate dehydrogenase